MAEPAECRIVRVTIDVALPPALRLRDLRRCPLGLGVDRERYWHQLTTVRVVSVEAIDRTAELDRWCAEAERALLGCADV